MFKIRQGLTLQQSPKHPGLVSTGSFMGIRFSISRKAITYLIDSSGYPSLKIENFREYMEAGLSGSMRNSDLIHSDLSASGPSTLSIFFTLKTKGMGGSHAQKEAKQQWIWKTYSW
jgi:hypothetical protein